MALIIDGKAIAREVRAEVAQGVAQFKADGVTPGLHVILVGNDPASETYVRNKELACADVGMHGVAHRLPESTDQATLERLVDELNADGSVHGILVQLPLPKHLDALSVLAKISADKDVDGLHQISAGRLLTGYEGFVPCTPRGIMRLIESTGEQIAGKEAVVIGRSNLVGKPVSLLLLNENATVTMCAETIQRRKLPCGRHCSFACRTLRAVRRGQPREPPCRDTGIGDSPPQSVSLHLRFHLLRETDRAKPSLHRISRPCA